MAPAPPHMSSRDGIRSSHRRHDDGDAGCGAWSGRTAWDCRRRIITGWAVGRAVGLGAWPLLLLLLAAAAAWVPFVAEAAAVNTKALPTPPPPRLPRLPATSRLPRPPPRQPQRPPRPLASGLPNFVVIFTDDQDEVLNSTHPAYMPALNSLVGARGTRFANTLVSTSVCCPARVSLLTGRLAHCTNITANWAPMGAWAKFSRLGLDSDWLPGWLQLAGYHTALVGKLLNGFLTPLPSQERCPLGFDHLDALTLGTYDFFNSSFALNCGPQVAAEGQYQTDVIRAKALSYIENAASSSSPFYLQLTPAAPHKDNYGGGGSGWQPPPPAERHSGLYPDLQLPYNPTLLQPNPLNPSRRLDMSASSNLQDMQDLYVGRVRSLRAVDEMLGAVVAKLSELGILNNTYVIYMSDNGLHMGQHGLDDGKATPLEEDSRVPLYISGPGVPSGQVSPYQANLVDFAPTVMALAGLPPRFDLDGLPLPLEGLTTDAYDSYMRNAAMAAARRAGLLPPSQPALPSPPPSQPAPPSPPPSPDAPPSPKRRMREGRGLKGAATTQQTARVVTPPASPPPPPAPVSQQPLPSPSLSPSPSSSSLEQHAPHGQVPTRKPIPAKRHPAPLQSLQPRSHSWRRSPKPSKMSRTQSIHLSQSPSAPPWLPSPPPARAAASLFPAQSPSPAAPSGPPPAMTWSPLPAWMPSSPSNKTSPPSSPSLPAPPPPSPLPPTAGDAPSPAALPPPPSPSPSPRLPPPVPFWWSSPPSPSPSPSPSPQSPSPKPLPPPSPSPLPAQSPPAPSPPPPPPHAVPFQWTSPTSLSTAQSVTMSPALASPGSPSLTPPPPSPSPASSPGTSYLLPTPPPQQSPTSPRSPSLALAPPSPMRPPSPLLAPPPTLHSSYPLPSPPRPQSPPSPTAPPPPPPQDGSPRWLREAVILEAWDSDAKNGFFPGITFKALRLCSTYQPNLTLPVTGRGPAPPPRRQSFPPSQTPHPQPNPQPPLAALSRPPALMVPQPADGPPLVCLKYVVWCKGNQRELYDLSYDPYETVSVLAAAPSALLARLDAVLSVLVHCRGADCALPYGVLHPAGDVMTFAQAMHPRHDPLYGSLPRFSFASCYPGYVPPNERTFTLGMPGFPANRSWASTGIEWPLPNGTRGIRMSGGE